MFGGINPKKMQAVMKQMGISQEDVDASRVIIEKNDGNRIVINNPSVAKIKMRGQESFQISGDISESQEASDDFEESSEESGEIGISEDDVKTVMEKTGASEKQARKSLEKTQDLAESILELSK
jgi:nascent polypeptide-associated complex subunit alpha